LARHAEPSCFAGFDLGEHERALGRQGFAEQDVVEAGAVSRKRVSSLLERALTTAGRFV
jgi:hypothetical protein